MKLLIGLGESWKANSSVDERPYCVIVSLKQVQLPQEIHIFVHDANNRSAIDSNNSRIVKTVVVWAKADAVPAFIAAARVMHRDDVCALNDRQLENAHGARVRILIENHLAKAGASPEPRREYALSFALGLWGLSFGWRWDFGPRRVEQHKRSPFIAHQTSCICISHRREIACEV